MFFNQVRELISWEGNENNEKRRLENFVHNFCSVPDNKHHYGSVARSSPGLSGLSSRCVSGGWSQLQAELLITAFYKAGNILLIKE